jgi:transcriptional repressor NrdR
MFCPFCRAEETKVIDSRLMADGNQVKRRRECMSCGERFNTHEVVELTMPRVIKRNGEREAFDEHKFRAGFHKALEKRAVPQAAIETAVTQIMQRIHAKGDTEMAAKAIGEMVMEKLSRLDQVAYVRFASVYRNFKDLNAFGDEISRLKEEEWVACESE